jgi:hypothetical protein
MLGLCFCLCDVRTCSACHVSPVTRTACTYHKSYTQTPAVNVQDGGIVTIRKERVLALSPQGAHAARNQFLLETAAAARGRGQLFHVRDPSSELGLMDVVVEAVDHAVKDLSTP